MLASSGEITEPCPVPLSLTDTAPASRTPALSHFWIRRMMRRSPIRCSRKRLTIVRERHPFEGRSLPVMRTIKRRGTLLLLVVLPDGSRSLIPANWGDWQAAADDPFDSGAAHREPCLAPVADLLRARALVDAVLGRCLILQAAPAADEESCHATDPGVSRSSPIATNVKRPARCRSTHRGRQDSRTHHRASDRDGRTNGGDR